MPTKPLSFASQPATAMLWATLPQVASSFQAVCVRGALSARRKLWRSDLCLNASRNFGM